MAKPKSSDAPADAPPPVEELGYAEASRELDDIVTFFDQRDIDVDLLVSRLERATAIIEELDRRLRRTRLQVEELVPRLTSSAGADRAPTSPDRRNVPGGEAEQIEDGEATI